MEWKILRLRFLSKRSLFFVISVLFFFSSCALLSSINSKTTFLDNKYLLTGKAGFHYQIQEFEKVLNKIKVEEYQIVAMRMVRARRLLSGPGSSPPQCASKCGKCRPCKAVHVVVPPGRPVTAEYYPETWRCKCGNKLYMP